MPLPRPDDQNRYGDWSDGELVQWVGSHAGPDGAGAQAELTRRLMETFRAAERQATLLTRLTWVLLVVTVGLAAVAVAQLFH
jgi:hypothetical protein